MGQCGTSKEPFYHPKLKHGSMTTLDNQPFLHYTLSTP